MPLHPALRNRARIVLKRVWRGIREWCGDSAYERYVITHAKHCSRAPLLNREEFYLQQLNTRYSRVSRCC